MVHLNPSALRLTGYSARMTELLHPRPMNRSVLAFVTVALALMYALCVMMFAARVRNSGEWTYFFVPGNLALAWLPLLFAILCLSYLKQRRPCAERSPSRPACCGSSSFP